MGNGATRIAVQATGRCCKVLTCGLSRLCLVLSLLLLVRMGEAAEEEPLPVACAATPVMLDGWLTEGGWARAERVSLSAFGQPPDEDTEVRLTWGAGHLYLAIVAQDRQIVQRTDRPDSYLFERGDTIEIFLKPVNSRFYFEFHITPHGHSMGYFFTDRRQLAAQGEQVAALMRFAVVFREGNISSEAEKGGYTAEIAIPLAELAEFAGGVDADESWAFLVSRYNYDHSGTEPRLSCYPVLQQLDFHRVWRFRPLRLLGAPTASSEGDRTEQMPDIAPSTRKD